MQLKQLNRYLDAAAEVECLVKLEIEWVVGGLQYT